MRGLLVLALLAAPLAAAQELSDSDFDTTPPSDDDSYLRDSSGESLQEPGQGETLGDGDFDTTVPEDDASYLDEVATLPEVPADTTSPPAPPPSPPATPPPGTSPRRTPGLEGATLLGGLVLAGLALRRW
jgi:hypothetical protein